MVVLVMVYTHIYQFTICLVINLFEAYQAIYLRWSDSKREAIQVNLWGSPSCLLQSQGQHSHWLKSCTGILYSPPSRYINS